MKYTKTKVNNINIHTIKTNKFKTVTISVNFREKIKKEEITIRRFLFQMLLTSSKKYNTSRLLEIELEDLYSTSISHATTKFGNLINSYIDFRFIDKKYTNEDLLPRIIDLLYELILNPNVVGSKFDSETFEIIKNKLYSSIKSKKDDASKYAASRAATLMDEEDPISYDLWGCLEDLEHVTEQNLYEYYKHVLDTNVIDIFIIGNVSDTDDYFKELKIGSNKKITPYITYKDFLKPSEYIEDAKLEQSKLVMISKILNITLFERRYVLPIYANILGGSSTSRLFNNVREKSSLCYTINATTNASNSIFTIHAGIDKENYERVVKLITDELILKNITDEELKSAKMEITSSLETIYDSPGSIINYYFGIEVFSSDELDKKIENYNKVTKKDLYELAKKIRLQYIYLLRGIYE